MRNESNVGKKNFICSWRKKHLIRNRSMTFVSAFFCLASFHLWSQILPHKQRKVDRSITRQLPPPEVGPFWPPVPPQENPNQANPSNSPTSEREQFYAKNITVTWIGTAGDSYNTFRPFFLTFLIWRYWTTTSSLYTILRNCFVDYPTLYNTIAQSFTRQFLIDFGDFVLSVTQSFLLVSAHIWCVAVLVIPGGNTPPDI